MTASAAYAHRAPEDIGGARPVAPPAQASGSLVWSETARDDGLGRDGLATRLARLLADRRTETPIAMAIFGLPGSGKSHLLRRIAGIAARDGAPPGGTDAQAVRDLVVTSVDLAAGADPARSAARALLDALSGDHAACAEEALHAGHNPHEALQRAGDRSVALRRTLDGERKILDDFSARRARLVEAVLFETAGTRVDGYARLNRARLETRLRGFGLPANDPLRTYKDLVRGVAEKRGAGARFGFLLRSLWSGKGQGSLLTLAILLFALGWAAGIGVGDEARLSGWLAGLGDRFAFVTDWERAHLDWLQPISEVAWVLGAAALVALVYRAIAFSLPVFRGAKLLQADLGERRRDIDALIAQQTRRIDGLSAEADAAARMAEQAERRLGGRRQGLTTDANALAADLFGTEARSARAAQAFCVALSQAMATTAAGGPPAPGRILVAVDGIDHLPEAEAATALETLHRLFSQPGFAMLLTLDRRRASDALGATDPALAAARLDRFVQLSYDLDGEALDPTRLAARLIETPAPGFEAAVIEPDQPPVERDLDRYELATLRGLAPFAGTTPRAVKRFVNAYRFARTDPRVAGASPAVLGCLAWALAVDGTPAAADLAGFAADAARGEVRLDKGSTLGRAFSTVHGAIGGDFSATDARRGLLVARSYARHG